MTTRRYSPHQFREAGDNAGGFTLVEVLVALSVIAIALAALLKGASEGAGSARYLRDKTYAHWVAMNTITEVQVRGEWPSPGRKEGEATMGSRDWHELAKVISRLDGRPSEEITRRILKANREIIEKEAMGGV